MSNDSYIKFISSDDYKLIIKLTDTSGMQLDTLLEKFKTFCLALGYHENNVERIQYVEKEEYTDLDSFFGNYDGDHTED